LMLTDMKFDILCIMQRPMSNGLPPTPEVKVRKLFLFVYL